ncbi:hypothetical protein ACOBV9_20055 (plasmid) [Pseudoalteromonas espejiana]
MLELAKETLTSQQVNLSLTQKSFDLGATSAITLEQLKVLLLQLK